MKKFKTIILTAGVLSLCSIGFSSCNDDDEYDFPGDSYNRVFNQDQSMSYTVIHTPLFSLTTFDASIPVKCTQKATGDILVSFGIDNSLIESYNEQNGTNYEAMPDGVAVIENPTVTIPTGKMQSDDPIHIVLDEAHLSSLTSDSYIIPVVMKSVSGGNGIKSSNQTPVSYFIVTTTYDNVKHGATEDDITGTKVSDLTGWSATTNSTVYADQISCVLDGNVTTYKAFQNRTEDLWITIDMGQNYTFDALTLQYGFYSSYTQKTTYYGQISANTIFETSMDGENWNSAGNFKSGDNNKFMAFYAPITARYLRVTAKKTGSYALLTVGEFNIYAK